jgi:hypothetical protein
LLAAATMRAGQTAGNCASPFEVRMLPGQRVSMHIRSGDIEITGTAEAVLRVTCRLNEPARARDVKISFAAGNLRIYGGPGNDIHFRIEVPEQTHLLVRAPAGDLNISGITGDKDVALRAGDLTIAVGPPESYRVAEGSVLAGDLRAAPFGVTRGGLFRSFRRDNTKGRYRLRAELLAGDLTLR